MWRLLAARVTTVVVAQTADAGHKRFEIVELAANRNKPIMKRHAFKLRIKPDAIEAYEREHQRVWPDLLTRLKEVGISDYSIFRRGQDLFLVLRVDDFDRAWDQLDRDPVNQRWQALMSELFEPVADKQPGERFATMEEVFYLE
jgi:L-rhamnose mutarotase